MAGLGYKIRKNLEVFGPYYVRILLASIMLMVIGSIIFTIGLHIINYRLALPFLGEQQLSEYTIYYPAGHYVRQLTLTGGERSTDCEFSLKSHGFIMISAKVNTRDNTAVLKIVDTRTELQVDEVIVYQATSNYKIELSPGSYRIDIETNPILGLGNMTLDVRIYASREKIEFILARWLQILGLVFMGLGLVIFVLSYEIARKEVEAAYMIPPKQVREMLARESYLRILASHTTHDVEPDVFGSEEEEEEE